MNAKVILSLMLALVAMSVSSVLVRICGFDVARVEVAAILVVYACYGLDNMRAAILCFCGGWLFDLMTGAPTGLYPFVAMLTFVICRVVIVLVDVRGAVSFALLCGVMDAFHQLLAWGIIDFFAGRTGPHPSRAALAAIPGTMLLTALCAAAMWPAFKRMDLAFDREESSSLVR